MDVDTIIDRGTILTVDKDRRIIKDGAIAIQKNRIIDLGTSEEIKQKYEAKKIINAEKKLVMPGLINAHHHFNDIGGYVPDAASTFALLPWFFAGYVTVTAEQQYWMALHQMALMIKTGTTCFADAGGLLPEEVIKATVKTGMRGSIGYLPFDGKGFNKEFNSVVEFMLGKPLWKTDECVDMTEDLIKRHNGTADGRVKIHAFLEGGFSCSDEMHTKMKDLANKYKVFVHSHRARTQTEVEEQLKHTGRRCIQHLEDIGFLDSNVCLCHMVALSDDEVDLLRKHDVKVGHCPNACFFLLHGVTQIGKIHEMVKAGLAVALGDDAYNLGVFDMLRQMHLVIGCARDARLSSESMTAETAVEMGTINGAKALGFDKEVGSLEIGKKADIIILNRRRLEWVPSTDAVLVKTLIWCATGDSVETVIIDGKIVMEDKVIKTVNELEVIDKIEEVSKQLFPRIKEKLLLLHKQRNFPLHEAVNSL